MNKKYIIKVIQPNESWPYYVTEVYAGYPDSGNYETQFSYKQVTNKNLAMQFVSIEDAQIVYNFVNAYNRKFHKAYQLYIEEIS